MRTIGAWALAASIGLAAPAALRAETVAILPLRLLDGSGAAHDPRAAQEPHAADDARLAQFGAALAEALGDATQIPPQALAGCRPQATDCLLDLARTCGADRALFVVIRKSATPILQVFATLVELADGRVRASPNLAFRGDSDESWRRAARFLARQLRDADR